MTRRWGLMTVATLSRQFLLATVAGMGFVALLSAVNAAGWLMVVASLALGVAIGFALPDVDRVREELEKGAPHGRGE